mmetsp:Transcript_64903/g.120786  ORF Transcript_64903/g.120786 Transcript_64903/m.120786 type:complete len:238 (-) Transcript_64903:994-1707(-)
MMSGSKSRLVQKRSQLSCKFFSLMTPRLTKRSSKLVSRQSMELENARAVSSGELSLDRERWAGGGGGADEDLARPFPARTACCGFSASGGGGCLVLGCVAFTGKSSFSSSDFSTSAGGRAAFGIEGAFAFTGAGTCGSGTAFGFVPTGLLSSDGGLLSSGGGTAGLLSNGGGIAFGFGPGATARRFAAGWVPSTASSGALLPLAGIGRLPSSAFSVSSLLCGGGTLHTTAPTGPSSL